MLEIIYENLYTDFSDYIFHDNSYKRKALLWGGDEGYNIYSIGILTWLCSPLSKPIIALFVAENNALS